MFGRKIAVFKLLGFQVWIDWSWFLLALLITWSLAEGAFPALYGEEAPGVAARWSMGVAGALGLFVCIVLHELGHSVVARRFGIRMRGITLFVFGGVAEMADEPPSAKAELLMALGGPAVSAAISAAMLAVTALGAALDWPTTVVGVTGWLGWINIVLVVFNMVPAFPLDGGRVLRAALWQWKGDLQRATRIAATIGGGFGSLLIVLGVLSAVGGNLLGGVWWFILGMFLRGAARASYQQVLLRRALEGEHVASFMHAEPVTVGPDLSVRDLVEHFVYRHQHKLFPVVDGDDLLGCVPLTAIRRVPRAEWGSRRVADIMADCSPDNTIDAQTDAVAALSRLKRTGSSRLMVVEDGRLVGMLALKDLVGFLSLKIDLEGQ